jgi:hypothetical protein
MRLKVLLALLVTSGALIATSTADARVRLVSVTRGVPGNDATLVASVSPARVCSITVYYKSGPSRAKGLVSKRPVRGLVSWTWRVGTNTTPGRWRITVSCGSAGTLNTSFVVVR